MRKIFGWIVTFVVAIGVYNFAGRGLQGIFWMVMVGVPLLFASEFYLGNVEEQQTEQVDKGEDRKNKEGKSENDIDELLEDV